MTELQRMREEEGSEGRTSTWDVIMKDTLPHFEVIFNEITIPLSIAYSVFEMVHEDYGVRSMDKNDFRKVLTVFECHRHNSQLSPNNNDDYICTFYKRISHDAFHRGRGLREGWTLPLRHCMNKNLMNINLPYWMNAWNEEEYYVTSNHVTRTCDRWKSDGCFHDRTRVADICMGGKPSRDDIAEYAVARVLYLVRNVLKVSIPQAKAQMYGGIGYLIDDWSNYPVSHGTLQMEWGHRWSNFQRYRHVVSYPRAVTSSDRSVRMNDDNFSSLKLFLEERYECQLIVTNFVLAGPTRYSAVASSLRSTRSGHGRRAMLNRKTIHLMEEAVKLVWCLSGFRVQDTNITTEESVYMTI